MDINKIKELDIPHTPGCYLYKDAKLNIIYVGKAADLSKRVLSYWGKSTAHSPAKKRMMSEIAEIEWVKTDSEIEALLLESNLIKKHQPCYNVIMRDDKRHIYIKVSTDDEIPGIFATRKIDTSGKYFGPFVSSGAVRETLKTIRKIWPYCTMRKVQKKPCFFYQVGRCTGVCGGILNIKTYRNRIIKPVILFFEGKKDAVIKELIDERNRLMAEGKNEGADKINRSITNMRDVLKHASVLNIAEKYSSDVIELAKLLRLPKTPVRIEGFDISNTAPSNAVGSMVVFIDGEPDKQSYRKFKIKISGTESGDVQMLKEVFERRFKRSGLTKEGVSWPIPDLIIVDGGKQQLGVLLKALKRNDLNIPAIAISKGEGLRSAIAHDKLFFPGEKFPLELPLASPALHIIKRVRDEAHRFAIGYHRILKSKNMFK